MGGRACFGYVYDAEHGSGADTDLTRDGKKSPGMMVEGIGTSNYSIRSSPSHNTQKKCQVLLSYEVRSRTMAAKVKAYFSLVLSQPGIVLIIRKGGGTFLSREGSWKLMKGL